MTRKQLSKVCAKAADEIEVRGFTKGDFGTATGPKCAVGACRFVANGSVHKPLDLREGDNDLNLNTLFKEARPRSRRAELVEFNDAARTRKHDVVELLRDMAYVASFKRAQ
jgi:hypothetical protein